MVTKMISRGKQQGTTAVEFAVVGLVFFMVLFGLIDFSRIFFSLAALDESTRRGARVAAVCPVNDPAVAQVATFSGIIPTLGTQHISVEYLDEDGIVVGAPAGAGYGDIRYVRVRIQNFQLQTYIPGLQTVLQMPAFETTIPSESLGRVGTADIAC
jgi:hypothetical protein